MSCRSSGIVTKCLFYPLVQLISIVKSSGILIKGFQEIMPTGAARNKKRKNVVLFDKTFS